MATPALRDALADIPSTLRKVAASRSRSLPEFAETLTAIGGAPPATADTMLAPRTATPLAEEPALDTSGPRYVSQGALGEGGMGVVERVSDRDLLRDVAVKHLRPELVGDARRLRQFLWEARVTAYLDHPNIVPVHDLGTTPDGQLFFTMKFVRGRTLEAALAEAAKDPDARSMRRIRKRVRQFLHLCNAISFAHARGVLHRDLKPANVMLGEFGEILVSDWGLAIPLPDASGDALRHIAPDGIAAESGGTPMYMSPEQVKQAPLDVRSDVYALGVVLYEVITLERAFEGDDLDTVLGKVSAGDAAPVASHCAQAPTSLCAVVHKAMALDPAERYPTVKDFALDIETVLDGRTPSADNASFVKQAARFYVAHDPGIARMRIMELDFWGVSAVLFGGGLGMLAARWTANFWWAAIAASLAISVFPTLRWLRLRRRGDDPDDV